MKFHRILLPVDFSERSRRAGEYARVLAERFDAELLVLHVRELPLEPYAPLETSRDAELELELADFLVPELRGLRTQRLMVYGNPSSKINEVAESHGVDLIMLPTHGYGPLRRFFFGSVAAKVLHDSSIPVWTDTHTEELPPGGYEIANVACVLDTASQAERVLRWADKMAREYHAALTVLHVVPGIEELLSEIKIQASVAMHSGDVAKSVRSAAEAHNADLLVIGRAEPGLIGRLRTHAYAIIRESPCPVLSV